MRAPRMTPACVRGWRGWWARRATRAWTCDRSRSRRGARRTCRSRQFDHADRALEAVRDMAGPRLTTFNRWLRENGLGEGFGIGIGVNSGIVMSGNIGSERRVEYTTIGDPVNTASRLEKLTKEVPFQVLISDTTRAMLRREVSWLRYVDVTEIRGKQIKANLWTIDDET